MAGTGPQDTGVQGDGVHLGGPEQAVASRLRGRQLGLGGLHGGTAPGRSGVLLTYAGQGHGSVTSGPCMEDAVDGYLTDLAVPARGTSCPAVPS